MAASGSARAQAPEARLVAAEGSEEPNVPVWETAIAAGVNKVMSIYRVGDNDVGYAVATVVEQCPPRQGAGPSQKPWRWVEEGLVPFNQEDFDPNDFDPNDPNKPDYPMAGDPSVAYDSVTGRFVLGGHSSSRGNRAPLYPIRATYDPSEGFLDGGWRWVVLNDDPNDWPWSGDKPWLVAGEVIPGNPPQQEFYICYTGGVIPVCLRSTNGGQTWRGGAITIDDEWVSGVFPGPAPQADGSLYLACVVSHVIFFLHGEDPQDPNDPMVWDYLYRPDDPNDPNDFLQVSFYKRVLDDYLPMPNHWCSANLFPLLAVDPGTDPNDPDVLYLVYHDIADPNEPDDPNVTDVDVDVFLHKLTEQEDGTWLAGGRVQVNDSDDPNAASPTDQFHPAVTVTPGPTPEETRVHVIFYDDRRFDEQIDFPADPNDPNDPYYRPKFDVFYAYSEDAGDHFVSPNRMLFLDDPDDPNDPPAVDYTLLDPNDPDFELRDYIGIARQVQGSGYRIWTSYMGMYADDPTEHKSVIWSSQIRWASP